MTNGVTPRRFVQSSPTCACPAHLITEGLGTDKWVADLELLRASGASWP